MSKEDITGGLALALQRGEPLEQAMFTFFNAGYKKEDIEAAARDLQGIQQPSKIKTSQQPTTISLKPVKTLPKSPSITNIPLQKKPLATPQPQILEKKKITPISPLQIQEQKESVIKQSTQIQEQNTYQKTTPLISGYRKKKISTRTIIIISLSALLVMLLLSLGGVFLFKNALIDFFNTIF